MQCLRLIFETGRNDILYGREWKNEACGGKGLYDFLWRQCEIRQK